MIEFILKNSEVNREPIIIVYQKGDEITQRKIRVNRIKDDIIQAYCFRKKALRNFKMENVLAATKSNVMN
tara:strand:- start:245 stop:454 length:210 start_codon:yes stop_codon:yes gene_type:complete